MSEITPEKIREFLNLDLGENDSDERTARDNLLRLLGDVWRDGARFDARSPFGTSGWVNKLLYPAIAAAGLVPGKLDPGGRIEVMDFGAADALVIAAIDALDAPRAAGPVKAVTGPARIQAPRGPAEQVLRDELERERGERLHRAGERDEARSDLARMHRLACEILDAFTGSPATVAGWRERAARIAGCHAAALDGDFAEAAGKAAPGCDTITADALHAVSPADRAVIDALLRRGFDS
jgi:hypothetical protein